MIYRPAAFFGVQKCVFKQCANLTRVIFIDDLEMYFHFECYFIWGSAKSADLIIWLMGCLHVIKCNLLLCLWNSV